MGKAGFPKYLTNWIQDFSTNRTLSFYFNSETELPKPFDSGLPLASPLSIILFIVYCAPTIKLCTPSLKVDSI